MSLLGLVLLFPLYLPNPEPIVPTTYEDYSALPLVDKVEYTDVRQGALGDCWFLSATASVALADPLYVEELVYGVAEKYDRQLPTRNDTPAYAQLSTSRETWVAMLEKDMAGTLGSYMSLSGGMPTTAYYHFGLPYEFYWGSFQVAEQFYPGRAVTVGTRSGAVYLLGNHALTVTGVNPLRVYDPLTRKHYVGDHLLQDITLVCVATVWSMEEYHYTLWADNYGSQSAYTWRDGDFNADGVVDDADYTLWADNLYSHSTGSQVSAPASVFCMVLSVGLLIQRRRKLCNGDNGYKL